MSLNFVRELKPIELVSASSAVISLVSAVVAGVNAKLSRKYAEFTYPRPTTDVRCAMSNSFFSPRTRLTPSVRNPDAPAKGAIEDVRAVIEVADPFKARWINYVTYSVGLLKPGDLLEESNDVKIRFYENAPGLPPLDEFLETQWPKFIQKVVEDPQKLVQQGMDPLLAEDSRERYFLRRGGALEARLKVKYRVAAGATREVTKLFRLHPKGEVGQLVRGWTYEAVGQ
jgi:hypothetical protein